MASEKKEKCPDCHQCQMCAESRCRKCREGGHIRQKPELGSGFTHGEYLEWKKRKQEAQDAIAACPAGCITWEEE
jgi:ferredoxin